MKHHLHNFRISHIVLLIFLNILSVQVNAFCVKDSESCVEGAEERLINGLPVYRDCWRFASQYTCDGTVAIPDSHCQDLIDQGCSPLNQTCDTDSCVQTYECNVGISTTQESVGCDSQTVAVDGVNFNTSYQANTDFGVAASNMAAMESAVTGMIKNDASCVEQLGKPGTYVCAEPLLIFDGTDLKCRKDSLGFNKCCNLDGWGVDSGLNVCNAEEELLGYARQADRTHYIGRYCTHSNVFGCYAHAYVYCSFSSEIGRIVQEQGRVQLSKGWGSATAPQCGGFTDTELTQIDFSLIDFSEYFADAFADMVNPPSGPEMESIVNTYINTLLNAGCSQFDVGCISDPPPVPPPITDPNNVVNWSQDGFYIGPGSAADQFYILGATAPPFIGLGDVELSGCGQNLCFFMVGSTVRQWCSTSEGSLPRQLFSCTQM
jgi:conjugal transfer mating pair stabilization protein TraN